MNINNFAEFLRKLVLLLAMTTAGASASSIVYSDLPAASPYYATGGYSVDGPTSWSAPTQGYYSIAMAFTPTGSYLLSQIDLALTDDGQGTNSYVITLNSDSGGLPGTVLMTWDLSGLPLLCCTLQIETPTAPLPLDDGIQYWIVAAPGSSDTSGSWQDNNVGAIGPVAQTRNGGGWMWGSDGIAGAFDVLGSPVPEPTSGSLLAGALSILIGLRSARLYRGKVKARSSASALWDLWRRRRTWICWSMRSRSACDSRIYVASITLDVTHISLYPEA
jgi:hypothetical protein